MRPYYLLLIAVALVVTFACSSGAGPALAVGCDEFQGGSQPVRVERDVEVHVATTLEVRLCSNPTAGFQWEDAVIGDEGVIRQTAHEFKDGTTATALAGAPREEVFTFDALKPGSTTIDLSYSRPWEGGERGVWQVAIDVIVD